jgi:cytidyltransferase-like protein
MTNEDSGWGPMMMFGVTGPGPKADRKPIPSDPKKEKGINIKNMKKMKNLKTFEEFILENNLFEAEFGSQKVVIFPGRFQPFHSGHIAALKKAHDIFRLPVVPVQILSKTDKSPFDDGLLIKIGNSVAKEFNWMAGYSLYPPGNKTVIPQMVKYLREEFDFEPVGMGCGSDRLKAYEPQIKYLNSEKSDVPVSEPFRLEICDERVPGGPSGTKVRAAILDGDETLFKELTPKSVHKFYNELKKALS